MAIRKGTGVIKRIHAKNFIHKEANVRLEESVKPYQQTGLNALGVDFFEVQLYQHQMSTQVCTCKQTEVTPMHSTISLSLPPNVINPHSVSDDTIVIDYARPLFGGRTEAVNNLDFQEALELAEDDDDLMDEDGELPTRTSENLFSANADCGICYRTGYVPGYYLYGADRHVLATQAMSNVYGYHINQSKAPHRFEVTDAIEGFVEFTLNVPRYFKRVKFAIRDNHEILMEEDLYTTLEDVLTLSDLRYAAGTTVAVRVKAGAFTHVTFEFDLGIEPLRANIAMMQKNLDWQNMNSLGALNVILPMTIQEVQTSDFIHVPSRNTVLKITDVPYLRTSQDRTLEWSVNSRVVQPMEPALKIHRGKWLV